MHRRAVVAALSCGGLALGKSAASPARGQPLELSLVIANTAPRAIIGLHAAPAGTARWGEDRIGGEAVPAGRSRRVGLPVEGVCGYDLRAVYEDGAQEVRRGVDLCRTTRLVFGPAGATPLPDKAGPAAAGPGPGPGRRAGASDPSFNLVNRSPRVIHEIYVSPATTRAWGTDLLGRDVLAAGGIFPVRLAADGNCVFDIRVVYDDGRALERRRVNTCALNSVALP